MADVTALERARMTIRGVRAELILEDGHLTLSKDGPPSTSLSFAVDQVRGTVLEPGSRGGRGWIHLAVVGGTLAPPGELAAMSDPYTIPLTSRSMVTARRLARIVEKHLHERGLPPEPTFAASALARGRFSSGVALTQAPGGVRTMVELRSDDEGPPPSPNGSSLAAERPASGVPTSYTPASPGDDEEGHARAVRIAAAEAAIDERAAIETGPIDIPADDAVDEPATEVDGPVIEVDGPPTEPIGAPGGWVKPSGHVPREATDPGPLPGPTSAPASASASASASKPSAPPPTAPPPLAPPTVGGDLATELRQLGELHASGVLTDAEFEQAKARVLR